MNNKQTTLEENTKEVVFMALGEVSALFMSKK